MIGYWNLYTEIACEQTIKQEKSVMKRFNLSTNVTTNHFDRELNLRVKGLRKIRINLTDVKNILNVYEPIDISPICMIEKTFDFDNYFAQNKLEQRKIILETLYESVVEMCNLLNYDLQPFTNAYKKVKERNYENKFIYGKLSNSPNRKNKAGIQIEINEETAIASVIFTDNAEKTIKKIELYRTQPHEMFIFRFAHKGKWTDATTYTVLDKSKQVYFNINLTDSSLSVVIQSKNNNEEKIREFMKYTNINQSKVKVIKLKDSVLTNTKQRVKSKKVTS